MTNEQMKNMRKAQVERLRVNCERMVREGTIAESKYNADYVEECDRYIARQVRGMFEEDGAAVVEDGVAHAIAAEFFNDELHGKWDVEEHGKDNGGTESDAHRDPEPPAEPECNVKNCKETPLHILDDF